MKYWDKYKYIVGDELLQLQKAIEKSGLTTENEERLFNNEKAMSDIEVQYTKNVNSRIAYEIYNEIIKDLNNKKINFRKEEKEFIDKNIEVWDSMFFGMEVIYKYSIESCVRYGKALDEKEDEEKNQTVIDLI